MFEIAVTIIIIIIITDIYKVWAYLKATDAVLFTFFRVMLGLAAEPPKVKLWGYLEQILV